MLTVVSIGAAGCVDDDGPAICNVPTIVGALPVEGDFIHPDELLPADECVIGGLPQSIGRWFVREPEGQFGYYYPRFEGGCDNGFRRFGDPDDDASFDGDGRTHHTWSDGTRLMTRTEVRYETPDATPYVYIVASTICMRPDGTLMSGGVDGYRFGDQPYYRISEYVGSRFAPKDSPARNMTLLGELGITPDLRPIVGVNLVVEEGFAYVAGWSGLHVIDVGDPTAPAQVGFIDGSYNDVKLVHRNGKRFAVLSGSSTTPIVDVSEPSAPAVVRIIEEYSHSVFVQETVDAARVYLANYESEIPIYDLEEPLAPVRLGAARVPGPEADVHDLYVFDTEIYANYTFGGFVAFDVADGLSSPRMLGSLPTSYSHASWRGTAGGRTVLLHGDEGSTGTADGAAFMRVLDGDTASPTFMQELARYQSRPEVGIHNIEMQGELAFISYYQDGVRVVDLADPTRPTEVAHYNTWNDSTAYGDPFEGALGVRAVGEHVYVADDLRGLLVLHLDR